MVVRYNPISNDVNFPNVNFMGAFAQGQAMQQNALRQQVLENQLEQENKLKSVISQPGFSLDDPNAVQGLLGAGGLDEAIKVKAAQEQARVHDAMVRNYINDTLIKGKRFEEEVPHLRAVARESAFKADTAGIDNMHKASGLFQDVLTRAVDQQSWEEVKPTLHKLDPDVMLPDTFNPKWNERMMRTAKIYQDAAGEAAKERAKLNVPKVIAPTENMPGMVVGPGGVSKIPEVPYGAATEEPKLESLGQTAWSPEPPAPVIGRPALKGRMVTDMTLPPDVMAIQQRMAEEEDIKRRAPLGREKEALGAYRFGKTLEGIGNTYIDLAKAKGITVPGESPSDTFQALANKTRAGEILGKLDASERLALVDSLRSQVMTAIPQFAAAAGLQSKNFDSDAEGKRLQAALANPDNIANISSAFQILNGLNKQFGTGRPLFEGQKEQEKILQSRRGVAGETEQSKERTIKRRGTYKGRPVVEYSDGTVDYAD